MRVSFFVVLLAFVVLAGIASSATGAPPAPGVFTDEPPKDVKELLARLKQGEVRVIQLLSERDEAAPYLRLELKAATDALRQRDLAEALAPIEARIYQRNKKRYKWWLEGGRIDLCTELLVACPEKKDAPELADLTFPLRQRIAKGFLKTVDPFGPDYMGVREVFWWPVFKSNLRYTYEAGTDLTLPPLTAVESSGALVRANRCTVQVFSRNVWFVAVRSELREELEEKVPGSPNYGEWFRSIVWVNNSTQLTRATESLIVCDGDVELATSIDKCVVIANGDIRGKNVGWSRDCFFAATGDIKFQKQKEAGKTVVREKQKSLPFGVRFLDPEEFGLMLAAQKDGVKVNTITKDSPFAKYGVELGDIITSIDDVKATSVPVFRRQLRQGLLRESVVLRIQRGNANLTRVVFLDDIPLPVAPIPREVKRPSP
jgi:hypothetical protein